MAYPKNIIPKLTLVQDKKSKIWNVSFTNPKNGLTYRRSTGKRNKGDAQQVAHAMAAQLTGLTPKSADYTMTELLNAYKASKDRLADTDERALIKLTEFFGGFKPEQLGDGAWKRYRTWRTSQDHGHAAAQFYKKPKKVADSTAVRELNVFRAAISWAQRSPHWKGLGHVRVTLPNVARAARQEFLTREEAVKLVNACVEPHQKLFVLLALATAARHRAILSLRWEQITWPSGTATPSNGDHGRHYKLTEGMRAEFQRSKSDAAVARLAKDLGTAVDTIPADLDPRAIDLSKMKTKLNGPIRIDLGGDVGNKRKPIAVISPTNVWLYTALVDAYKSRTTDFVIEWKRGSVGHSVDRVDLSDAYRRAGLKKPSAPQHVLKHTAISWMVQEGKEIAKISALTRTSIPTIEKVYGHLAPSHLEVVGDVLTLERP